MEHPSIASNTEDVSSPNDVLSDFNFVDPDGIGASVLDQIMRERSKHGVKKAACQRQEEGCNIKKNVRDSKIMSSGLPGKNGVFGLDNPSFVEGYYKRLEQTKQETLNKAIK